VRLRRDRRLEMQRDVACPIATIRVRGRRAQSRAERERSHGTAGGGRHAVRVLLRRRRGDGQM